VLRCDGKVPEPLQCTVDNAILVTLRFPAKYALLPKLISHKKLNEEQWKTQLSESPHEEIKLAVDVLAAYEVKSQLYIKGVYESEYSPTITITDHQTWADQIEPDYYLFDAALWFIFPSTFLDSWRYRVKTILWVKLADKPRWYTFSDTTYQSKKEVIVATDLYSELKQDTLIEWKLQFVDNASQPVAESKIHQFELKKREEFLGIEHFHGQREMSTFAEKLILARSGKFLLDERVKGNFIIIQRNNKFIMKLFPEQRKNFDNIEYGSNELIFLPEILTEIFELCRSPPNLFPEKNYKPLLVLSLVCKYWFNIFKRVMVLEGEYSPMPQDYYKRWQLHIKGWEIFV
jgi:hypothetical protein